MTVWLVGLKIINVQSIEKYTSSYWNLACPIGLCIMICQFFLTDGEIRWTWQICLLWKQWIFLPRSKIQNFPPKSPMKNFTKSKPGSVSSKTAGSSLPSKQDKKFSSKLDKRFRFVQDRCVLLTIQTGLQQTTLTYYLFSLLVSSKKEDNSQSCLK